MATDLAFPGSPCCVLVTDETPAPRQTVYRALTPDGMTSVTLCADGTVTLEHDDPNRAHAAIHLSDHAADELCALLLRRKGL